MSALASTTVDDAKSLLSVLPLLWAILTGTLLATALRWSSENDKYDRGRSWGALAASVLLFILGVVVGAVLGPLAYKAAFTNHGSINGYLVLYEAIFVLVVGLAIGSVFVIRKAFKHLRDVLQNT